MLPALALLGCSLLLLSCTSVQPPTDGAPQSAGSGDVEPALRKLERRRDANPENFEIRLELGRLNYRAARKALDEGRQDRYARFLKASLDEVVEAARIRPRSPAPHTWMGIVAAYQNALDRAETSFRNALKLDPKNVVTYLNIAQIRLYKGDISTCRHWIEKARRQGARGPDVDLLEILAAWRQGDLVEARDVFALGYDLAPEQFRVWDEAPVEKPIETFEDFTAYCCANPTCGPNMGTACKRVKLQVKQRELRDETVRQELVIEMERRRKLREIYEERLGSLGIEIEQPEPVPDETRE